LRTVEIVDELIERFKGWGTDGPHGVLRYLNQAHEILLAQESFQTAAFNLATGGLPVLRTNEGQFEYFADRSIWRVGGVLLPYGSIRDYGVINQAPQRTVSIGGREYYTVNGIRTFDWQSENQPARILFSFNPKGREFFLRAWKKPKLITSVNIQHEVPPPLDVMYLIPAAAKLIEGVQNGTVIEARLAIEAEIKPKFWAAMNKGEQSEYTEPVARGF
jgi:hypothetical protein